MKHIHTVYIILTHPPSFLAKRGAASHQPRIPVSGTGATEEKTHSYPRQAELLTQPMEHNEELHWQRAVQNPHACQYHHKYNYYLQFKHLADALNPERLPMAR